MSDKLTDVQVAKLKTFVKKKDRYGYWNYLGNVVGVPYAKLALQVVTNEGQSGYIANNHAENRARELGVQLDYTDWWKVGVRIMEADFAVRTHKGANLKKLTAKQVQDYHEAVFKVFDLDIQAWTAFHPLNAVYKAEGGGQKGIEAMDALWEVMVKEGIAAAYRTSYSLTKDGDLSAEDRSFLLSSAVSALANYSRPYLNSYRNPYHIDGWFYSESGEWRAFVETPLPTFRQKISASPEIAKKLNEKRQFIIKHFGENIFKNKPVVRTDDQSISEISNQLLREVPYSNDGGSAGMLPVAMVPAGMVPVVGLQSNLRKQLDLILGAENLEGAYIIQGEDYAELVLQNGKSVMVTSDSQIIENVDYRDAAGNRVIESRWENRSKKTIRSDSTTRIENRKDGQLTSINVITRGSDRAGSAFQFTADETGQLKLSYVGMLNGQRISSTDERALVAELNSKGFSPEDAAKLANGSASGEVSAIVTKYEAAIKQQILNQHTTTIINDIASVITAIQGGKPLPILSSGLKLVNDSQTIAGNPSRSLNTTTAVVGGLNSLYSLSNSLKNGDDLSKVTATLGTVNYVNSTLPAMLGGDVLNSGLNSALNGSGNFPGVLPALGLINSIKNGDAVGTISGMIGIVNPSILTGPVGWILTGISLLRSFFSSPPKAWGTAKVVFDAQGTATLDVVGKSFGKDRVRGQLQNTVNALNSIIERTNKVNPGAQLAIIPQRMPTVTWREARKSDKGYQIVDIDPQTGERRYPYLRWDDKGIPFSSEPEKWQPDPTDPNIGKTFPEQLLNSALRRGALAAKWEADTARAQQIAGDPYAGLTEVERAARQGLSATYDLKTNTPQGQFRPVTLDLDGDGKITTIAKDDSNNTVGFNWDNTGFKKQTAWIDKKDGFLFLDRNLNGVVDSGAELSEDNENFCINTLTVSACPTNFIKISHKNAMLCATNNYKRTTTNCRGSLSVLGGGILWQVLLLRPTTSR